jgi:hypothetical protein
MDYKRAYEELREVYLKDKQAADEMAELVAWFWEIYDLHFQWDGTLDARIELRKCYYETKNALRKAVVKD